MAARPLPLVVGDVGCRMTVVRLADGGLWLHSPVPLDAATQGAVDALGPVRWLVGPSRVHHLFLGDWARAYPAARLLGAPGLAEKRRDLHFHGVLCEETAALWSGELRLELFGGAPSLSEVVFLHPASRTLLLTDLAFHVRDPGRGRARLFHWLVGATGRFGPHRIARLAIRDRAAARRSLERILAWDFDRVVVTHGEVLETGGHRALAESFAFLG